MGMKYRFDTKIWKNVKQILNEVSIILITKENIEKQV